MWTRALTGSELANLKDLVIVDPQSEDLLAYWKMDQHEVLDDPYRETYSGWTLRNKMVDITGHGHDAFAEAASPTYMEAIW
ncbi:MAG: hypothetical protein LUE10_00225 [Alistipes sp.]|nr:hypothetical protein [Alistipes sp.]